MFSEKATREVPKQNEGINWERRYKIQEKWPKTGKREMVILKVTTRDWEQKKMASKQA